MKQRKSASLNDIIYESMSDIPEIIKPFRLYVVGEGKFKWVAVLVCPCGCNGIIYLNLLPEASPRWRVFNHKGNKASIYPSVFRKVNCRSHFTIKKGSLRWVSNK